MTGIKSILKPILTEKAASLQDDGVYVFEVSSKADKSFIKKTIEEMFNVEVRKVNVTTIKGKMKRGKSNFFQTKSKKKAIVMLKSGQKIQLVDGG
tara:strand:+ start:737 stop:1021 length:285 start_codon:yes stop_codon:yes gene_type:complete